MILVEVVDGQAAALANYVSCLAIQNKLDSALFQGQIFIFRLIQSHANTGAASAKALDKKANAFALVLRPVETLEGFGGGFSNADQVRIAHDEPPFLQSVIGREILETGSLKTRGSKLIPHLLYRSKGNTL